MRFLRSGKGIDMSDENQGSVDDIKDSAVSDPKLAAEIRKLDAEIRKLEREERAARWAERRKWIVSASVAFGIVVSAVSACQTLHEIGLKNRQLALESQVKSSEIFLNLVLERVSGFKSQTEGPHGDSESQKVYNSLTRIGSYGLAVALACHFET